MSRIFVPVSGRHDQRCDRTLADIKRMGAERVCIAIEERFDFTKGQRRDRVLSDLKEKVDFYRAGGLEVCVWIDTLGYGGIMPSYDKDASRKFTRIRSIRGEQLDDALCPLDPDFADMMCELIADIVRVSGTRMLMLDDELCLSVRPGIGCACENHLRALGEMLGEKIELSDIPKKVFMGAPSRYRDAWLELMKKTLVDFATKVRAAVDAVDPEVRIGFCSGYTSWDLEGADAMDIARALAGGTAPFLRYSGAPYWVSSRRFNRQSLATVIECTRMQHEACIGSGIETFTEADTYPRDRFNTPAALSECFDDATRGVLGMDVLKYVYEYSNQPTYDTGYVDAHTRAEVLRDQLSEAFSGKKSVGIRIYEHIRKIGGATLPIIEDRAFSSADEQNIENLFFSPAANMLSSSAIPTVYSGNGVCGIAFGECARYIDRSDLERGMILDAKAAKILSDRGIDTGIGEVEYIGVGCGFFERFPCGEDVVLFNTPEIAKMKISERAEVQSEFVRFELYSDESYPASYRYENENGERFLVLGFDAEKLPDHSSLLRSYMRAKDICDSTEYLGGEPLPARCDGHPMLYSLVSEGGGGIAAAYINIHPDAIERAVVKLARGVKNVKFIGCEGRALSEREIEIHSVAPYKTVAFFGEYI